MNPMLVKAGADIANSPEFKQSTSNTINTVTNIFKVFMFAGLGFATFLIARKFYKKYKEDSEYEREKEISSNALKDMFNSEKRTLSISEAQAKVLADSLYMKMEGFGTSDEEGIVNMLIGKTPDDILLINMKFGVRDYGTYGSPMWGKGTPKSLWGWFEEELSESYLKKLKPLFQQAGLQGIGNINNEYNTTTLL